MQKILPAIILTFGLTLPGFAQEKSAAEVAKELANPNTALASLNVKSQFRTYDGDLPNADEQEGFTILFQPGLPFPLENGDKVIWRPAIPFIVDQPVFDAVKGDFEDESGLGDIVMDIAYAPKTAPGTIIAFGGITSLPTGDDGLTTDRYTLGPELLIGKLSPTYVLGAFPNHQWDVGGSGDTDISLTSMQVFMTYLPGGGWNVGSSPTMSYDWEGEEWTIPLQLSAGKTVIAGGRAYKLSVEANYYVEKPDAFGPDWMLSFNVAPVVKNFLADLF